MSTNCNGNDWYLITPKLRCDRQITATGTTKVYLDISLVQRNA